MHTRPRPIDGLLAWYRRNRRDLPWRRNRDPYRIWLSEVMLQQTRVDTVVPFYERFVERFPALRDLARAREDDVLGLWSGLGYYRRARALLEGARAVESRFGGRFPRSIEDALTLPGVGPYTAAAVLSIAYGLPHPVVDGNVERVITRFLAIAGNPRRADAARRIREIAGSWLPRRTPGEFNQALMELGAMVCTPAKPRCAGCPLASDCAAHARGEEERHPELERPRKAERLELEAGVLRERGRFLLERSSSLGFLEFMWVFPLADITPRNGRAQTRFSGIAERLSAVLGMEVRAVRELPPISHAITFRRITLRPIVLEARPRPAGRRRGFRWAARAELGERVPVSSLCLKIARRLEE